MNLFLPEETIVASVEALDDKRLIKQILECKTILDVALDEKKKGYAKHPVVAYYKDYPWFVALYGAIACEEYVARFGSGHHKFYDYFYRWSTRLPDDKPKPFYCEGAKTDPNCIRTTKNTVELFRQKLCNKWDNDKIPPKWTNRKSPEWYKSKDKGDHSGKCLKKKHYSAR